MSAYFVDCVSLFVCPALYLSPKLPQSLPGF